MFSTVRIAQHDDALIARLPVTLHDGRPAYIWCAEITTSRLTSIGTYGLFKYAEQLISSYRPEILQSYKTLSIPALQIDYQRSMQEIVALNPQLADVTQIFKVALDETGARVHVETTIIGSLAPRQLTEPRNAVFGAGGPVLYWLTEPSEDAAPTPFAVMATTAEAWLEPDQEINFDVLVESSSKE